MATISKLIKWGVVLAVCAFFAILGVRLYVTLAGRQGGLEKEYWQLAVAEDQMTALKSRIDAVRQGLEEPLLARDVDEVAIVDFVDMRSRSVGITGALLSRLLEESFRTSGKVAVVSRAVLPRLPRASRSGSLAMDMARAATDELLSEELAPQGPIPVIAGTYMESPTVVYLSTTVVDPASSEVLALSSTALSTELMPFITESRLLSLVRISARIAVSTILLLVPLLFCYIQVAVVWGVAMVLSRTHFPSFVRVAAAISCAVFLYVFVIRNLSADLRSMTAFSQAPQPLVFLLAVAVSTPIWWLLDRAGSQVGLPLFALLLILASIFIAEDATGVEPSIGNEYLVPGLMVGGFLYLMFSRHIERKQSFYDVLSQRPHAEEAVLVDRENAEPKDGMRPGFDPLPASDT